MNRNVGAAVGEATVELLGPQRLAAHLGERPVLDHVAARGDGDDLDPLGTPAQSVAQRLRHQPRLGERQWRSEEHTSELQSLMRISSAVSCLKKKNTTYH